MRQRNLFVFLFSLLLILSSLVSACSAQQTEAQALATLRQMSSRGQVPSEAVVADIESRFAGKQTGALAKLLHARIRFDNKDYAGAAAILNSDTFVKTTKVADHALWLRGQALQNAGNHADAMKVFDDLIQNYPDSVRSRDAKLAWANSAIASGHAVDVPGFLIQLSEKNDPDALLATAKAYEAQNSQNEAIDYYRRTYFFAAGSPAAVEAEAKLTALGQPLTPQNADEQAARADRFLKVSNYQSAVDAYGELISRFPGSMTPQVQLRRLTALANSGKMVDAQAALSSLPAAAKEREEGYRQLVLGYAKAKMWPQTRSAADEMRQKFPSGKLVPGTLIDAGLAARAARNRTDEAYFLSTAVAAYPAAIEIAQAQFESAWVQHENGNFALSSQMLVDHLARFTDKDTTNRGKAGYWAARDSERAGKIDDACALYDGVNYRYGANWYGYLAQGRLATLKDQGKCGNSDRPLRPEITKAIANLKKVTVAAETATAKELARVDKSEELTIVGLFDWAIDELQAAKKTAGNSPKINLALAQHYRLKGDNVNALLSLAKSYPDYAQMFPEEMGREEWDIFYPLTNWSDIKFWANARGLDRYQVAGIIRQETIFDTNARSGANAYGLMQLLFPTAKAMARKYGSRSDLVSPESLYQAPLNIELGTAYMKDQFAKFGRIEYVAVAYNAGPGRVGQWRASLPPEMDDFVEEIPFKETKGYVQGIIRNSAQYRRLYDDNGNFNANVGTRPLRGEIDSKPREQFTAEYPEITVDDRSSE